MSFDEETRDTQAAREAQAGLPARRAAVELLAAVIDKKQPLDDILSRSLATGWMFDLPQRDRALARAIVGTSLRRRGEIDHVLGLFLERGLPDKSGKLYPILLSGAAQLIFLKTPPHAAIDLAVRLAQWDSRARRYDKLVNAVLRRVAKEGDSIAASLDAPRVNTPDWLWERWVARYGEDRAHRIAAANLIEPPLDLTVKSDPEHWAEQMSGRVLPNASVRLLPKGRIEALPGFDQGAWWVQDVAASLPAHLMGRVAGKRVLDLCAAPGGKTAQLALAGASVVAVDISKTRLKTLSANLARLGLAATTVAADATTWSPESVSTQFCSTRRAHRPGPSAAIPTSPISNRRRTSWTWPYSRRGFWTMPRRCSSPAVRSSIPPARSNSRKARPRLPRCSPGTLR